MCVCMCVYACICAVNVHERMYACVLRMFMSVCAVPSKLRLSDSSNRLKRVAKTSTNLILTAKQSYNSKY